MTEETLEKIMWQNTAWRYNHRNGLDLESFHGLDRDIQLFCMLGRLLAAEHQPPTPQSANSAEILAAIANRRRAAAERVLLNPEKFCVCEGCSTVLAVPQIICKHCHCYRFDYSAEGVVAMATLLGAKTLATSSPVLPRYGNQINMA